MIHLTLPFPPTVNTYWRHVTVGGRPRTLLSEEARKYRTNVEAAVFGKTNGPITGPLKVEITYWPPNRLRRDLDNLQKGLLDALHHCRVYEDDRQIWSLTVRWALGDSGRKVIVPGGRAEVTIEALQTAPLLFDPHKGA